MTCRSPHPLDPASARTSLGRLLPAVLLLLTVFGPISMDLYLPLLPALTLELDAATSMAQLTVTACLIGLALGQLVAGPLSDRFGRRIRCSSASARTSLTSVWCAVAPSVEVLIVARFVQGLAGGVGLVIAQAAGRDLYSGAALIRYFGRLTVLSGLAAIVGPLLGGLLATVTDWRGLFVFLAADRRRHPARRRPAVHRDAPANRPHARGGFAQTARDYRTLLRDRRFVGAVLVSGFAYAALFAYLAGATYVLQGIYGLTPQQYALAFGLNSAGFMVFGWLAARAHGTVEPARHARRRPRDVHARAARPARSADSLAVPVGVVIVSLLHAGRRRCRDHPAHDHDRPRRVPADGRYRLVAARDGALRVRRLRCAARRHRRRDDHAAARHRHGRRRRPGRGIRHPAHPPVATTLRSSPRPADPIPNPLPRSRATADR